MAGRSRPSLATVESSISAQAFSGGLSLPPPPASAFGITDADDAAWVERHLTPHPIATYALPMTLAHPIGNGVPATYIRCTDPGYANTLKGAEYAKSRPDWQYLEIHTGHDAMISAPAELTRQRISAWPTIPLALACSG